MVDVLCHIQMQHISDKPAKKVGRFSGLTSFIVQNYYFIQFMDCIVSSFCHCLLS